MRAIEEVLAQMAGAKVFSVLDGQSGFWENCLDKTSSRLFIINTPFGCYGFTRLPFGIASSAPEGFQRAVSRMLENLPGVYSTMDDIIVWAQNVEEHDKRLQKVLERAKSHHLPLNLKKCRI